MIIQPNGHEIVRESKNQRTVEKAMSIGFEDAMKDKDRECDYEFWINTKDGRKYILCEVKLDNGYNMSIHHPVNNTPELNEIERQAYKFLIEKL